MKILTPFGPRIGKFKISSKIINSVNKEVERISENKNLKKKYDYSDKLVGHVSNEIELNKKFINKNLKEIILSNIKRFVEKTCKKKVKNIKIKNLWVVSQFSNEFNPVHYHDGHISGVGYLKLPKKIQASKNKVYGSIDFINGNKMFLSESIHNHKPKVGDVIIFPNYLMHTVYPFNSNGERRSFSFNVEIDSNIANVFKR